MNTFGKEWRRPCTCNSFLRSISKLYGVPSVCHLQCLVSKAQVEVLGNALAYFTGPLRFPAFPPTPCSSHSLSADFLFPHCQEQGGVKKTSLLKLRFGTLSHFTRIPQHFPKPLVPSSPDAWDPCTSPCLFSSHLSLLSSPHLSVLEK